MPRVGLDQKIQGVRSSLQTYAKAARKLGELIDSLYGERGVFDESGSVPRGLILGAVHFGVEAAQYGASSDAEPTIREEASGEVEVRIGGWMASFSNVEVAEMVAETFAGSVREISGLPETRGLIDERSNYEKQVAELRRQLSTEDRLRITIGRTSCSMCAQDGLTVRDSRDLGDQRRDVAEEALDNR